MGRAILTLLCLWTCTVTVTSLTDTQVHRATQYIKDTFNLADTRQYAYVAVFSEQECDSLSNNNNLQILQNEDPAGIADALNNKQEIYAGTQMVLATYGERGFHSEYRLLFPLSNKSNVSPVEQLVNTNPNANCVIFYSLNTPCVGICADTTNGRNIIQKLQVFNKFNNNKAFVYSIVYVMDFINQNIGKEKIWEGLKEMNNNMDVYRCFPKKCIRCFDYKNKGHCINN
ncbi:uncharacterized protein LOC143989149 [Lithobates pipiens]